MRNMKKKIIFVFLTGFFLLALVLSGCGPKDLRTVKVAYACKTVLDDESPDSAIGYVEHRVVDVPGERMYFLTLQLALYDPDTRGLVSPFPDNTIIRGVKIDSEGVVNVTYSDAYAALDGMSRTLAELCTLYTLTQFPEVKGVRIYVGDEAGEILRPEGVITGIESLRLVTQEVTLYYPSADKTGLVAVTDTLTISEADSLSEAIVQRLIAGNSFESGFRRHIAQKTRCISAETKSRTCYVNLSVEFLLMNVAREDGVSLTVYSVVDSLCQLPQVDRVQFLIEGAPVSGNMTEGFDTPFEPDYTMIVTE